MTKVLLYSHFFAPRVGGAETAAMLLARGLVTPVADAAALPLELTVMTETPAGRFDDKSLPFPVIRQPGLQQLWKLIQRSDVVLLKGPALRPMAFALAQKKPLAVEHFNYQAICPNGLLFLQPEMTACPNYFMARNYWRCFTCNEREAGRWGSLLKLLLSFPRRLMCKKVQINVAVSAHVAQRLSLPNMRVIYHGIEDPAHAAESTLAESRLSSTDPALLTFGFVGRLVVEKGAALLIKAAKVLKDQGYGFQIKIIGDGPERRRLQAWTQTLDVGDRVSFTGFLEGAALEAAMKDVAVIVSPTLIEETAGLTTMEYMMRGKTVVVPDAGGLKEMAGDAGVTFIPGDVTTLADGLKALLEQPDLLHPLGERARERARSHFQRDRMVQDYRQVIQDLSGPAPLKKPS